MNKWWKYYFGLHRGTLISRDSNGPTEKLSLEECREQADEDERFVASIGYQIWFCYAISPDGERVNLKKSAPYY